MESIFIFKAANGFYGFTRDKNGANLPVSLEGKTITWQYEKVIHISENEAPRIGLDTAEMLENVNTKGFYITQAGMKFEEGAKGKN